MAAILFTTILALSALYVPQPLLPVLTAEFGVARETAALLTTIAFIPLSLAPLFYGALLETVSALRMLRLAVLLLAITEVLMFVVEPFAGLMTLRLFQGLLLPAILTSLMTYTSQATAKSDMARAMAWYIAATILGGFAGRAFSGLIASLLHWRFSFLFLGFALLVAWFWLGRIADTGSVKAARPSMSGVGKVLADPIARTAYAMVFCFFLVFAAIMNYLPFRLTELSTNADEFRIGMAYSGYLMGIVVSLNAVRIHQRCGGAERAMVGGLVFFVLALLVMTVPQVSALVGGMFLLCGASFLTHATATGYLNRYMSQYKGVVNGLYVAFYYGGGGVGSYLPGYVYRGFGWSGFISVLIVVLVIALLLAVHLSRMAATLNIDLNATD
ncbi:MAG: MFS transporter [Deltaproteobacteria bacterium]|nr:MAG: MFS transporter [Deltaproteobacteria bacterium]